MTNQAGGGLLSPWLQRRRLQSARRWLRGAVLDVGAGNGALAAWVGQDRYVGVEPEAEARAIAVASFPSHRFEAVLPASELFDTVAALAVVEHVPDPVCFLSALRSHLRPGGHLVVTTPHPVGRPLHDLAARLGLASAAAAAEHQEFLGRRALCAAAHAAGLALVVYERLLLGLNQLAVFQAPAMDRKSRE
jgi:2-polyprenyl-3-methyl-5-hydroxy-6-metoxy-1,4-benzoquinol methylase